MPYREPDPLDPLELVGVRLPQATEDELAAKARCLAEELLLSGYDPEFVTGLFQTPQYAAAHELWLALGAARIREIVADAARQFRPGFEV